MSKRVLIILAAGFVLIIAGIFLLKHELTTNPTEYEEEPEPEPEPIPEPEPEPIPEPVVKKKTKLTTDENGTEKTE